MMLSFSELLKKAQNVSQPFLVQQAYKFIPYTWQGISAFSPTIPLSIEANRLWIEIGVSAGRNSCYQT